MIPAIGYMIGFYIITRMVEMLGRSGERRVNIISTILAAITILVTIFCLFVLFSTETSASKNLNDFLK